MVLYLNFIIIIRYLSESNFSILTDNRQLPYTLALIVSSIIFARCNIDLIYKSTLIYIFDQSIFINLILYQLHLINSKHISFCIILLWFLQSGSWFRLMILFNCRNFIRIPHHLSKVIYKLLGILSTLLIKWSLIVGGLHLIVLHAFGNLVEMVLILVAQSTWCFENLFQLIVGWIHIVLIHFYILELTDVPLRVICNVVFYQVSSNSSLASTSGEISVWDP